MPVRLQLWRQLLGVAIPGAAFKYIPVITHLSTANLLWVVLCHPKLLQHLKACSENKLTGRKQCLCLILEGLRASEYDGMTPTSSLPSQLNQGLQEGCVWGSRVMWLQNFCTTSDGDGLTLIPELARILAGPALYLNSHRFAVCFHLFLFWLSCHPAFRWDGFKWHIQGSLKQWLIQGVSCWSQLAGKHALPSHLSISLLQILPQEPPGG